MVHVEAKGYGSALRGGIAAAGGTWIIMGDADDSYDFREISGFVQKLRGGCDLVMGCRLPSGGGKVMPGAMPWKNRWIGTPILSLIGRVFFKCPAHDFNCGLRGFSKAAYQAMEVQTTGMSSPRAHHQGDTAQTGIDEVPITLHKDGRTAHRTCGRGVMAGATVHVAVLSAVALSDTWLGAGGVRNPRGGGIDELRYPYRLSAAQRRHAGDDMHVRHRQVSLVAFASSRGLRHRRRPLPDDPRLSRVFRIVTLEKGVLAGLAIILAGFGILGHALWIWRQAGYGILSSAEDNLRQIIPASTLIVLGIQIAFSSFFMSALGLKTSSRRPPATDD